MFGDGTVSSAWTPEVIGYTLSGFMYGVTLGQAICYAYWFPHDWWYLKALVWVVLLADTVHIIGTSQFIWWSLVYCHRNLSWSCRHESSWGEYVATWFCAHIIFAVECFYCCRVWTITGKNKPITLVVFMLAILGYASGIWFCIDSTRIRTIEYTFSSPLILPYASFTTLCDFIITFSVFKYMWNSGFRRRRSMIQDLALVCIATGASTCMIAVLTTILVCLDWAPCIPNADYDKFLVQGHKYWVASMNFVIGRSYVISMLTVLNARKTVRDQNMDTIELTPIRATLVNPPSHPIQVP